MNLCEHANEVPYTCPCPPDCYCRGRQCPPVMVKVGTWCAQQRIDEPPTTWDLRFLELSKHISRWSKDPSTKTGAVLVRPDKTIASLGFNGFAKGMLDNPELYANREVKYSRVVHCEMNAVMFCRDPLPLTGYTLYTTGPSCERCAVHMVQAGIRRFVFEAPTPEQYLRWGVENTLGYFREVNAEVIIVPRDEATRA